MSATSHNVISLIEYRKHRQEFRLTVTFKNINDAFNAMDELTLGRLRRQITECD
jgi:hypothetical protein